MNCKLTALALCLATPLAAAETDIQIASGNDTLAATLNLPEGSTRPPVVLMLHGFTGQRQEFATPEDDTLLYAFLAEQLAAAGIASLRIDFAGSGDSTGAWAETTFSSQVDDAVAAFDHLQARDDIDTGKIGILGYSQGGLVGAHLAGARPEATATMLWAPVTNPLRTYSGLLGAETVEQALAATPDTPFTAPLSWGGETTLNAAFFHDLVTRDPAGAIASYGGPLAVVVGLQETIVTPQPAAGQILLDYHEGEEKLIEIDSDHDWGWGTSKAIVASELAPATVAWFSAYFE